MNLMPMRWWHIEDAIALDADLFGPEKWSLRMMWSELAQVYTRYYLVMLDGAELVGYAGLAELGDEASV